MQMLLFDHFFLGVQVGKVITMFISPFFMGQNPPTYKDNDPSFHNHG